MINYSVGPRINPQNLEEDPLFFATAQIDRNLDINEFAKHIASHGCGVEANMEELSQGWRMI